MERPDPMIPCKPGAQDVEAMANRQRMVERAVFLDGRDQVSSLNMVCLQVWL